MFGLRASKIVSEADPKAVSYRLRILYVKTAEYLQKRFPPTMDRWNALRIERVKKEIGDLEESLSAMQAKLAGKKHEAQCLCPHPIDSLVHGGYACSGTPIYDETLDSEIHETVECQVCGYSHGFGQEVTEEYRDDD
jgi:hypothetical protein